MPSTLDRKRFDGVALSPATVLVWGDVMGTSAVEPGWAVIASA